MIDGVNDGNESNNDYDEEEENGMYDLTLYTLYTHTNTEFNYTNVFQCHERVSFLGSYTKKNQP